MFYYFLQHYLFKDEVRLQQQGIVFFHPVLDQRERIDIVGLVIDGVVDKLQRRCRIMFLQVGHEVVSFVAYDMTNRPNRTS